MGLNVFSLVSRKIDECNNWTVLNLALEIVQEPLKQCHCHAKESQTARGQKNVFCLDEKI